jgi:hypothetical protein
VEAQISFEGIRLKGNRSKMAIILRAITMLDKRAHDVSASISSTYTQLTNFQECDQSKGRSKSQGLPERGDLEKKNWIS